ncbi:unnamed protein product [Parnassius apollo]|uniref:(apollo) hypothetical protein n=1 Tax=Parnassius apollo TaxID=110799 RepID=A0A8S3W0X0_PARAO|nr:unnamed protein product [Parnassius apollo]
MYKTPPQNKSAASTEDFNKRTEKPVPTGGKDKGSTSSVRKSIGELESRLGAAPKNIKKAQQHCRRSKIQKLLLQMGVMTTKWIEKRPSTQIEHKKQKHTW